MWWMSLALAAPPTAVVLPSQAVEGSVSVAMPPSEALAHLADPTWVREIDGGTTRVTVREREGACVLADYSSPSLVMTVRYTIRQCPTGHGYLSTLVQSADFAAYESEWSVAAEGAGSRLTYRVRVEPKLPLPLGLITGTIRGDVLAMMEAFAAKLGGA